MGNGFSDGTKLGSGNGDILHLPHAQTAKVGLNLLTTLESGQNALLVPSINWYQLISPNNLSRYIDE